MVTGREIPGEFLLVCEVPVYSHTDDFLSPVIRNENGGSMPAAVLCEFSRNHDSMRCGVFGGGKNRPGLVRVPAAVLDVEIKPVSFSQHLCLGFLKYIGSRRREALDLPPGCVLQRDVREIDHGIHPVGEVTADLLVNTEDNAMTGRVDKPGCQNIANAAHQDEIVVPLAAA